MPALKKAKYEHFARARSSPQFGFLPSPSFDCKRFVAVARTIRSITTLASPDSFDLCCERNEGTPRGGHGAEHAEGHPADPLHCAAQKARSMNRL